MKRDWDLIREILLKVEEECTSSTDEIDLSSFPDDRATEISYHARLLIEAGLVNGRMIDTYVSDLTNFEVESLTWEGHEFIDSIRSSKVWEKTKSTFVKKSLEMTFELVRSGATQIAATILNS